MVRRLRDTVRTSIACDEGVTLSELIVAMCLMTIVLTVAWNLHAYMAKVSSANEREAYLSSEIRTPLMTIDKFLMQNCLIEGTSDSNYISFLTDTNLDDVRERTVVQVSGAELRITRYTITGAGSNDQLIIDQVLSRNNANSEAAPLFTYLDSDGNVISSTDDIPSRTRSVTTNIVVDYGGVLYSDSRETHLRNRE